TALRRIRGPDLESNIVDLGLVSEVLVKDGRVSFSITVAADRAAELEPLRQAAQQVVSEIEGVTATTVVLTADKASQKGPQPRAESPRVAAARATMGAGAPQPSRAGQRAPLAGPQPQRKAGAVPGVKHLIAVASGKGGVGK